MTRLSFLGFFFLLTSAVYAGDPSIPGHHPLSKLEAGRLLVSELQCAACHNEIDSSQLPRRTAPDLAGVGTRVSPAFLMRFLASPENAHPGTTMPNILASQPEGKRQTIAEALTHFLIDQSAVRNASAEVQAVDSVLGKELFHSIGCVACHGPRDASLGQQRKPDRPFEDELFEEDYEVDPLLAARNAVKPDIVSLDHVAEKYSVASLSEFLFQPLKVRSSGRMPDMKLTPAESSAIAGYLIGEQAASASPFVPDAALVASGKEYFESLNCVACHSLPGLSVNPSVHSVEITELTGGCLADDPEVDERRPVPHFVLDDQQVDAIRLALQEDDGSTTDKSTLAQVLTAFRCISCHTRDEYGGVHDTVNAFFKGDELNLGDDGRIPPPLTLVGAKLQSAWMKKVLFDGESVRQYMATRMPQYGEGNIGCLPELFQGLDVLEGPEFNLPKSERRTESEREQEKEIRAAGRELLGDKGANCIACHKFNGKAAQVNQGIDLLTTTERLQPAWFYHYLQNPGAFRPRTVMPSAWPDGQAAFTKILDGDTQRQIEAIWYYLSLGTSAADPSGVRAVNTKILVEEHAKVYRGRSRVAGFRGIAVGLPEGLNYAFNAETGSFSAIWSGEFISVNWSGQGSGDFNPLGKVIALPQDVSLVALPDVTSPWPLLPTMSKEAPVNPDPLYPKNVGYQFRGYFLDEHSVPTFVYRHGSIDVEDKTVATEAPDKKYLTRLLTFKSESKQTVWFRALVGDIQQESGQVFSCGPLRLTVPECEAVVRPATNHSQQKELLLRLQVPAGESTVELQYEPL